MDLAEDVLRVALSVRNPGDQPFDFQASAPAAGMFAIHAMYSRSTCVRFEVCLQEETNRAAGVRVMQGTAYGEESVDTAVEREAEPFPELLRVVVWFVSLRPIRLHYVGRYW